MDLLSDIFKNSGIQKKFYKQFHEFKIEFLCQTLVFLPSLNVKTFTKFEKKIKSLNSLRTTKFFLRQKTNFKS